MTAAGSGAARLPSRPRQWRQRPAPSRWRVPRAALAAARRAARRPRAMAAQSAPAVQPRQHRRRAAPRLAIDSSTSSWRLRGDKRDIQSRSRSSATCGWCASRTARSRSRWSRRAAKMLVNDLVAQASRTGPAGAGWSWSRASAARRRWQIGGRCAQGRARGRRARRSAGQGGAGAISRRRDRRRARRTEREPLEARRADADAARECATTARDSELPDERFG